jgi:hypothetical protein
VIKLVRKVLRKNKKPKNQNIDVFQCIKSVDNIKNLKKSTKIEEKVH